MSPAELRAGVDLAAELRAILEHVEEQIGLGVGHARLECEFRDGRLAWFTKTHVRMKPSELGAAGCGTSPA